ncbi:MAG: NAD(P)-dependent oxidoreductase [Pseudomonadota bacterium]
MRLLVAHPDSARRAEWIGALRSTLPAADIAQWDDNSAAADYAVGWAVEPRLFATQPRLKAFFCAGAGLDDLLTSAALPPGLPLLRIEDAGMGEQMADYCSAAVLGWLTHREAYRLQQQRREWRELAPARRADWPIGVFGVGALGRSVAARFAALGFAVSGCTRTRQHDDRWQCYATEGGAAELVQFVRSCRVLILTAPLTPATRGLFDAATLGELPRGAYVINVARGALTVESAVLALLDSGHLAGAALDVVEHEPLPPEHAYWSHPRIELTPHIAAFTLIEPAAAQIAARIRLFEAAGGVAVTGLVRRDLGY